MAMVMLALAPWAVRQLLRLFSLLTHHPRYQGKYICCHRHCHYCKWYSKCLHKNGNASNSGCAFHGSLYSMTTNTIASLIWHFIQGTKVSNWCWCSLLMTICQCRWAFSLIFFGNYFCTNQCNKTFWWNFNKPGCLSLVQLVSQV